MVNQAVGRPWTVQEDQQLIQAVSIHGDNTEKWKTIALSVPGRTNKACRKRWLHSLSPSVKKTAWTSEEDQLLLTLYAKYSTKWSVIARHIEGRTDDACSKRYREALDPTLNKDEWTDEEDIRLLECYARLGGKWGQVGQELQRSGLGCRNRWRLLERKKNATTRETQHSRSEAISTPTVYSEPWPFVSDSILTSYQVDALRYQPPVQDIAGSMLGSHEISNYQDHLSHQGAVSSILTQMGHGPADMEGVPVHQSRSISPPPFSYTSSSLRAALAEPQPYSSVPSVPSPDSPVDPVPPSPQPMEPVTNHRSSPYPASLSYGSEPDLNDESCQEISESQIFLPSSPESRNRDSELDLSQRTGSLTSTGGDCVSQVSHVQTSLDPDSHEAPRLRPINHVVLPTSMQSVFPANPKSQPRKRRRIAAETSPMSSTRTGNTNVRRNDPPKLASNLPATSDRSVLAYVCGYVECWPPKASVSNASFATSGELSEHFKEHHWNDPCGSNDTPFRCGLEGCKKGWKSINGLQYHLQISKAHFRKALSKAACTAAPEKQLPALSSATDMPSSKSTKPKRIHRCPQPNCTNQYKQISGLRYHLAHGHPHDIPLQLDVIPPILARLLTAESRQQSQPEPHS